MPTDIQLDFDASGESQTFVATRPVRNSEHANEALDAGAVVFFRRDRTGVYLAYASDGSPTNGNQYARFDDEAEAAAFAARAGFVLAEADA